MGEEDDRDTGLRARLTVCERHRVEWFKLKKARRKLKAAQVLFLDRLQAAIAARR